MANFSVVFEIRHSSKENLSWCEKFKINEHLVEIQYHVWLLSCSVAQLAQSLVQNTARTAFERLPWAPEFFLTAEQTAWVKWTYTNLYKKYPQKLFTTLKEGHYADRDTLRQLCSGRPC
jgi:hypothetical protein